MIIANIFGHIALFGEKIKLFSIGLGGITYSLSGFFYFYFHIEIPYSIYLAPWTIIILIIIFQAFSRAKIWDILKTWFFVVVCEEAVEMSIEFVLVHIMNKMVAKEILFILGNAGLLILCVISTFLRIRNIQYNKKRMNTLVTVGLIVLLVSLLFAIGTLQYVQPYVNNEKFYNLSNIFVICSYFGIVFLGIFVVNTRKANDEYKYALNIEKELRKQQKNNYNLMLEKEEATKEFRHDFQNHMICLTSLIERYELEKAKVYMEQMQVELSKIQQKNYATGNEIIDAILNYYLPILKGDVEIIVEGRCSANLGAHYLELCSVVSNAVVNAIEAVKKQKEGAKKIFIKTNVDSNEFTMRIWNTCNINEIVYTKKEFQTSKKEQDIHGFGLKNIKKIVDKNKGIVSVGVENGGFQVLLQIPIIAVN